MFFIMSCALSKKKGSVIEMKKSYVFLSGFLSSFVLLFLLSFLDFYPFNNIWNPPITELKQQELNQREEAIKQESESISNEYVELEKIRVQLKAKEEELEEKIQESKVVYTEFNEDDLEHRIKVNFPIYINGEEKNISSFELTQKTYVDIEQLSKFLNNLSFQWTEENKSLILYERSGFGILNDKGEKYIEVSGLANRYDFLFGELPYTYQPDGRTFLERSTNNAVTRKFDSVMYGDKRFTYDALFIKQEDLTNQIEQYLNIIYNNEIEIMNNPEKKEDMFPYKKR